MTTSLLLVTSNGTGMGHLARQLSIGLAAAPARVTLMSMSAAIPAASSLGVPGEYCPGPDRDWIPPQMWPHYVAARIQSLAFEVEADVVVFDGVAPYRGITLAKRRMHDTPFVWFRRGMWRPGVNRGQLWKSDLFDLVIEPGDLAHAADRGATAHADHSSRVPPVSLFETVEVLPREVATSELGLNSDVPAVLLTLGTGRLGDVSAPGSTILESLLKNCHWQIAVVTSAIAEAEIPPSESGRVIEIRDVFPLVRYLSAFDAAVSAAGYNAVHELIPAGLPTLLTPNHATRTDDQVARASHLASKELALSIMTSEKSAIDEAIVELVATVDRGDLAVRLSNLDPVEISGGAAATVQILDGLIREFRPTHQTIPERVAGARDDAKALLKRLLGPNMTNRVRRALGRPPEPTSERIRVAIGDDIKPSEGLRTLRVSSGPTVEDLLDTDPVEHLLDDASSRYRAERRQIIDQFYDVVGKD